MAEFERMSERDLLMTVAQQVRDMQQDISEIKGHARRTNGSIAEIKTEQNRMEGALSVLKWLVGVSISIMGVGAAVAGLVLGYVARGG